MTILQEITAQRRLDVAAARASEGPEALRARVAQLEAALGPPLDVLARLSAPPVSVKVSMYQSVKVSEMGESAEEFFLSACSARDGRTWRWPPSSSGRAPARVRSRRTWISAVRW